MSKIFDMSEYLVHHFNTSLYHTFRFDHGMVAFLDCLQEVSS